MASPPPPTKKKRPRPPSPPPPLKFYPSSLFHLSPVHSTWAKLTAQDVYSLQTHPGFGGQNIYFYLNHPIKWVRLVGMVVSFDEFEEQGRILIHLDDGSGSTIQLVHFKQGPNRLASARLPQPSGAQNMDFRSITVGSVVKAKGEISEFRNSRQITLLNIVLVKDTNAEAEAWSIASAFKRDVLLKPWLISDEDIKEEKRRRRAQQEAMNAAAEKERLERIAGEQRAHRESSAETVLVEQKPKKFHGRRREKKPERQDNWVMNIKREREVTEGPSSPGYKRVKKEPVVVNTKREREASGEPVSQSYKRVKKEPELDTVEDRERIQEIVARWENAVIAASKAGKKIKYNIDTRHKVRIKEEPKGGGEPSTRPRRESKSLRTDGEPKAQARSHKQTSRTSSTTRTFSHNPPQNQYRPRTKPEPLSPPPLPAPPAPPDPAIYNSRSLKLLILTHLQRTPLPTFTLSSLRLIPEIEAYATKVAAANSPPQAKPPTSTSTTTTTTAPTPAQIFQTYTATLRILVGDGNIFLSSPQSSYAYVTVGRWNLGDIISEAVHSAKQLARRKAERAEKEIDNEDGGMGMWRRSAGLGGGGRPTGRVMVRGVWMRAQERGGGWKGVTKGVVGEVVREVLEGDPEGGWVDVGRGIWEWEVRG